MLMLPLMKLKCDIGHVMLYLLLWILTALSHIQVLFRQVSSVVHTRHCSELDKEPRILLMSRALLVCHGV